VDALEDEKLSCSSCVLFSFSGDGNEQFISFEQAVAILHTELKYPEHRAMHFVKRFDHNNDGRLSAEEFNEFLRKVEDT
jgi:Ca2+-binding EF-hand superfamily protein